MVISFFSPFWPPIESIFYRTDDGVILASPGEIARTAAKSKRRRNKMFLSLQKTLKKKELEDLKNLQKTSRSKKKRKRSPSSSSATSGSSETDTSMDTSDEDLLEDSSNWGMLSTVWPVEHRPVSLQDKTTFNKLDLTNLLTIAKFDSENKRAVGGDLSSSLVRDKKPRTTRMSAGADNCFKTLHPVRFLRYPLGPIKRWWKHVPRVRSHMFKSLPLRFSGSHNKLTAKIIQSSHDRTKPLTFKMFHTGNLNVASRPLKKQEKREDKGVFTTLDFQWDAPTSLSQVTEALLNYCSMMQMMWPYDPTGLILLRLVNKYNHISAASSLTERINIITTFFNTVTRENASRAERKEVILSYEEQEECLKGVLINSGVNSAVPALRTANQLQSSMAPTAKPRFPNNLRFQTTSTSTGNSNNSAFNNSGSRNRVVMFAGIPICFNYNTNTCRNTQTPQGCVDSGKKNYALQCNKYLAQKNDFCLMKHPRQSNH